MDRLARLILLVLVACFACETFASQCLQYKVGLTWGGNYYESSWSGSPHQAGADLANKLPKTYSWSDVPCQGSWSVESASTSWVALKFTRPGCNNSIGVFGGAGTDNTGGTPSSQMMECNMCEQLRDQAPNNLTCTGSRCAFYMSNTPSSPLYMCDTMGNKSSGCMLTGTLNFAGWDSEENAWATYSYDNKYTGYECTVSDSVPGAGTVTNSNPPGGTRTVPEPPPQGKCPGEVNGQTVLVDCDRSMTPGNRTTTTFEVTPDGSTRQTTSTTGETTTCVNGTCTTRWTNTVTVTVTPSGGGTGTTTQTTTRGTATESLSDYCEDHPNATPCQESQFSGTCQAGFTCNGDAATCAIAKAVNETKCLFSPGAEIVSEVQKMINGTYAPDPPTSSKSVGEFNQSNPFSNSCPSNQTLTLAGFSVVIPFASICSELQTMGNVLVAFTLLAATVFVLKGLGGS